MAADFEDRANALDARLPRRRAEDFLERAERNAAAGDPGFARLNLAVARAAFAVGNVRDEWETFLAEHPELGKEGDDGS